jgi:hypothetical protein
LQPISIEKFFNQKNLIAMKIKLLNFLTFLGIICAILSSCEETQVPIPGINLSQNSLIIEVDSTATLVVEIEPPDASNKTLKWNSSDTKIAKVSSDGIVSGISPGTAIITVESHDGHIETRSVYIIKIIEYYPIEEINFGGSPYMSFDNYDNLWYGGLGGVYKIGFDGWGSIFYPLNTEVQAIDFDSENNLWAATSTMGILKFDGQTWSAYDTLNSELPTNKIRTICIDQDDALWVGLVDSLKVGRFDGVQWKFFGSEECLVSDYFVFKIIADKQNNIWFGHYNGVSKFDGSSWELLNLDNKVTSFNILDIEEDNENNMWFTSTGHGVFKYDGTDILNYNPNNSSISSNYIQSVGIDIKGNKWFGLMNGVSKFNGTDWINITSPNFFIPDVREIAIDSEGNKWLASPSRIYQLID